MKKRAKVLILAVLALISMFIYFSFFNGIYSSEEGFHIVQLNENGKFEEKYVKEFDVKYSTKKFNFDKINSKVVLKIVQLGGEFADIEQISLEACGISLSPEYARYTKTRESVLEDILHKDNNVIIMHKKEIEISWNIPESCNEKLILSLTANEYGEASPFSFSESYILGSGENYSVFWTPSTGHPDGYTYVNVSDDNENIYFLLDITPDNTNDYGEDWTEIEINGKIFRVDDFNDEYGKCWFGLTDSVPYKHQVCEVAVPKNELGIAGSAGGAGIGFTLRYYGTAGGAWDYITACQVINVSGSYTVTADLSAVGTCISVNVSAVYLDCDGYEIVYGTGGGNGVNGINVTPKTSKAENYTIMNCNVKKGSNTGTNGYGISLLVADDSVVRDNNISVNGTYDTYGIYIEQSENVSVFRNKVSTNGSDGGTWGAVGIYSYLSNYTNITENKIYTAGHGLDIGILAGTSVGVNITNNNIFTNGEITKTGSDEYGIYIYLSNYSWILNNNITTNGTTNNAGIFLDDGAYNNVSFNTINASGNGANNHGVYLRGDSIHNVIVGNNISTQGTTNNNAFMFSIFGTTQHPEGNNITGNIIGFIKGFSVNFSSPSINHTLFVNQYLENYSFEGDGEVMYFKDSSYGEIRFSQPITGMGANLSDDIKIKNNSISVNSAGNTGLNKSANVTLYGISTDYKMPLITRDNKLCPATSACTNTTSLKAGTVLFNVTSFSNFSIDRYPGANVISPVENTYIASRSLTININLDEAGACYYSLDRGVSNNSLSANSSLTGHTLARTFTNGNYMFNAYCNDSIQLMNNSVYFNFSFNVPAPVEEQTVGSGPSGSLTTSRTISAPEEELEINIEELCIPSWECSDWGLCENGISSRSCSDVNDCGSSSIPSESMACSCTPSIECSAWSSCNYVDEVEDIITGEISVLGYKERACADSKNCIKDYEEKEACITSKAIISSEENVFGENMLILNNAGEENPVATINIDALKEGKLEISFLQGKLIYSSDCFDGLQNGNETQIDCGDSCKKCADEIIFVEYAKIWPWWILIVLFILLVIYSRKEINDRKLKGRLRHFVNK